MEHQILAPAAGVVAALHAEVGRQVESGAVLAVVAAATVTDASLRRTMEPLVRLAAEGGVATITLDSPRNRNALSRRLVTELREALVTALGDDGVRVIVLTGAGTGRSARAPT